MILCIDIGNSHIYAGVFEGDALKLHFRKTSQLRVTSDEMGVFFRQAIREGGLDPEDISAIAICAVVPHLLYSLRNACIKYFDIDPLILQAGIRTGLKILYRNPVEVGADRIANAMGAIKLYPNRDLMIVDFGTATTFCLVSAEKEYLGGVILAGVGTSMEALEAKAAKLPSVEIVPRTQVLGRSTIGSIQSGLYFGQIGMVRELKTRLTAEAFPGKEAPFCIGTGGFSRLFLEEPGMFDVTVQELVLKGLIEALKMNPGMGVKSSHAH